MWSRLPAYAIDLTYLPFDNRETALANISDSLGRIRERITKSIPGTTVNNHIVEGNDVKLFVQSQNVQIKIEVNTTPHVHLHPVRLLQVNDKVQEKFKKIAAIQVVSDAELYGGKICAALVSHMRTMHDVLQPHLLNQPSAFEKQFKGMSGITFNYEDLESTLKQLIEKINSRLI